MLMVIRLGHLYSASSKPSSKPAPFCLESIGRPTSKDFFCVDSLKCYYRDRNLSMDRDLDEETDTLLSLMTNGCIDRLCKISEALCLPYMHD